MKLKYLGRRAPFYFTDGVVFSKTGEVLEVPVDEDGLNESTFRGKAKIFEVIHDVEGAEIVYAEPETPKPVKNKAKRR